MQKKQVQLGRGMAALLGGNPGVPNERSDSPEAAPTGAAAPVAAKKEIRIETQPMLVDVDKIVPNKGQPRKIFKEKDLLELAESIKENGVIQPLLVVEKEGFFEIIAGERRYRASKLAGLNKVPVIVKRATKKDAMAMAIIENVQRSDLNCVEEALAYFQLMNEFELTQEEVAKKIGKDRSTIANFLRILKLPKDIIVSLQKEMISFGHAKILVSIGDDETTKRLANEVISKNLSVRELEELAKKSKKPSKKENTKGNKFLAEQYAQLKNKLEQKTGYHFNVKPKKNGGGELLIKFSNEAEFNDIFSYLMK
ncbi:MAG TPA: ParB/RepB/Spo0J family partition protein [Bacteriovoracaceae bacterium]|nr:ParB/RepB/Spo0J family partition protein [Bacteriovoracaceae bacterium]